MSRCRSMRVQRLSKRVIKFSNAVAREGASSSARLLPIPSRSDLTQQGYSDPLPQSHSHPQSQLGQFHTFQRSAFGVRSTTSSSEGQESCCLSMVISLSFVASLSPLSQTLSTSTILRVSQLTSLLCRKSKNFLFNSDRDS